MKNLFQLYTERLKKQHTLDVHIQTETQLILRRKGTFADSDGTKCEWDQEKSEQIRIQTGIDVCVVHTIADEKSNFENYSMFQWVKGQLLVVHFQLQEKKLIRSVQKVTKHGLFYKFSDLVLLKSVENSGNCLEAILTELPQYRLLHCTGSLDIVEQ